MKLPCAHKMGQSTLSGRRENSLSDRLHCPEFAFQPCQSGPETSGVNASKIRSEERRVGKGYYCLPIKWVNRLYMVVGRIRYLIGYIARRLFFSPASQVLK